MQARLVVHALENVIARRGDVAGCFIHSDPGSQPRRRKVLRTLERRTLFRSMGEVVAAVDNAAIESFVALPQKNFLGRRFSASRMELPMGIFAWTARKYRRQRRQAALKPLTPLEFKTMFGTSAARIQRSWSRPTRGCATRRSGSPLRRPWPTGRRPTRVRWEPRSQRWCS